MNVGSISYHIFICAAFCALYEYGAVFAEKLNVCVVRSPHTSKEIDRICPNLKLAPFQCVIAKDRFDCLRRLSTGEADMAALQAEDLVAASMYNEYDLLVTHELRLFYNVEQQFEMVVLVRQNIKNVGNVKGKRFCHPGFESSDTFTKALSMYFENWIIPKECNPKKTLLENRIESLSNFFEEACIAGPWIADAALDTQLKSKYKNLCALCDNAASCYTGDKYHGVEGAILCLTDNVGDIAWVRLDAALVYFKSVDVNKEDYSYLCPDGMTRPVKTENPCVWLKRPSSVILTRNTMAQRVVEIIDSKVNDRTQWKSKLQDLLMAYHTTLVKMETMDTPADYLRRYPGFLSANNRATCRPSRRVRWCVSSNLEDRKCRWLREASLVYGIDPAISCNLESSRASCLEAIRDQRADIFVSIPEERLQVSKKGLKPILHVTSNKKNDLDRIVAIVKKDSPYKSLKDLKGAKACFTKYESIGWNAFVTIMRNISNWGCSDINAVGNFFGDSCVPGLPITDKNVPHNLYSLCHQDENAADDIKTMSCLKSGRADVVFVNLKNVQKEINILEEGSSNVTNKQYKILCMDKTLNEKDEACSLTWTTLAAVVAHENITDLRRTEIYSMLLSMDEFFGASYPGFTPAFSLYGTYDDNRNVIFPVSIMTQVIGMI
ncbi:hypothetical protein KPH14_007038 [Odynerus spinipes]|uniref:Transferrin n=1 Tax=Odynerus spinipes TaxID=1348599 RepID=A0AAD9VS20_9HYME|nr:hypothetical protein KPH14_007038 [Odynerus spinipes]